MKLRLSKKYIAIIMAIVVLTAAVYTIVNKKDRTINIEDGTIPLGAEFIPAKDAGMVPGEKGAASKNANQLIKALNQYGHVIIDDSYYITTPTETLTTRDVEITGIDNAELVADNNSSTRLFDTAKLSSFSLADLTIRNINSDAVLFVVYNGEKINNKIERVNVEGCTFSGDITLYRQYGNTSLDPEIADFGVGDFIFRNNKVYNTEYSFIVLQDIPVKYCEISNNSIQNFMYSFLCLGISNDIQYEEKLYSAIEYLKVDSNKVICEDEWWGNTSSGSYYTFILFEGTEVLYNNNHVEGMKTLDNIALYDAYLSARTVNYTNNTWINNICFADDKKNNTLLKSKGGGNNSLVRNYSGNTFIVEEGFAERVGQSKVNLHVDFISLTQHADSYTIANNDFDIFDLRFPASSLEISSLKFNNNIIKASKASGNLAIVRLADGYSADLVEVKENLIDIADIADKPLNLLKVVDARLVSKENFKNINVSGNQMTAPISYLFYTAFTDNLVFSDNKITDVSDKFSSFAYKGSFNLSESSGNSIMPKDAFGFDDGMRVFGMNTQNGEVYEQSQ